MEGRGGEDGGHRDSFHPCSIVPGFLCLGSQPGHHVSLWENVWPRRRLASLDTGSRQPGSSVGETDMNTDDKREGTDSECCGSRAGSHLGTFRG